MAKKKNPHAQALGRKGGRKRMALLTKAQRRELATKAINARWSIARATAKTGSPASPADAPTTENKAH